MSESSRLKDRILGIRHPILVTIVIGVIINILMMTLAFLYDTNYWAVVVKNIQMGEGLYGLRGYYYTPVWGYILGFVSMFDSFFFDIGEMGVRLMELLGYENGNYMDFSANVTSIGFMMSYKLVIMVFDVVLAYLMYWLVKDVTKDERKAQLAFVLTFLCPTILASYTVLGMPDVVSATMLVLSIVLLRRDHPMSAGACFAVAVLNKFFPALVFFPIVAYAFSRGADKREGVENVVKAFAGALLMSVIIMLPHLLDGNIMSAFSFLTDRAEVSSEAGILDHLISYSAVIVTLVSIAVSLFLGMRLIRNRSEGDDINRFMWYSLVSLAVAFIYPPNPQYTMSLFPFLVYCIVMLPKGLMGSWISMSVGGFMQSTSALSTLLLPLAVFTGIISVDAVMAATEMLCGDLPLTYMEIFAMIGNVIQYVGILLILYYIYTHRSFLKGPIHVDSAGCVTADGADGPHADESA